MARVSTRCSFRRQRLLHQLQPLHHAEPVLLVHDHQPQVAELDLLFDQGVRPDHQLRVALRDVPPDVALAPRLHRPGQQHDAIPGLLQDSPRRQVMLRRQDLRRRHQRRLVAVLDRDDRRLQRHNRLPRPDVALQQPPHRRRLPHVVGDLLQHPLLRRRGMKRQDALDRLPHPLVNAERNSRQRPHALALQLQPQLEEEQLLEDQPDLRRRARRLQIFQPRRLLRPVRQPERLPPRHQPHPPPHRSGIASGDVRRQVLQRAVDHPPEPARRYLPAACRLVNRHNPPDLRGLGNRLRNVAILFIQNFKLRIDQLQMLASHLSLLPPCRTAPPTAPAGTGLSDMSR